MNDQETSKELPKKTGSTHTKQNKVSFLHLVLTSMAAGIGVQSRKNLEKDFNQQSPFPYIIAGILFTAIFLGTIILVVKLVLSDI